MEFSLGKPMTKEGIVAIATKMMRIWKPDNLPQISVRFRGEDSACWDIRILLDKNTEVSSSLVYQVFMNTSLHFVDEKGYHTRIVSQCATDECQTYGDENVLAVFDYPENLREFVHKWIPIFRRGCFLVGVPFQHTQHEKMEWLLWYKELEAAEEARSLEDLSSDQSVWCPVIEDEMYMGPL